MKILVTGAAGFIGSHLSERLHSLGHEVVGVDNFSPYYCVDLKKLNALDLEKQGIKVHKLDLVTDKIDELTDGVEAVFHMAAQPGISASVPLDGFIKNNINATENLYQALKDVPSPPKPTSYYGVTKLAAEQLVLSYQRDKKFPACSIRPFSVYGERERPDKLYPKVINSILNDVPFPFYEGSEKHLRSYTYVGDMIDGYVSVLDNIDKCIGEIFNFGFDGAITTGEGIKIIEDYLGKKAIYDIKPPRQGDQLETRATIKKARDILGYNPTTAPKDGLKKEVDWFKEKIWKKIDLFR
jgi:UDP-glucuronate 4-epimerase